MQLRPFKELFALSKEKLDEAMAPIRARQVRSQANLEQSTIDADLLTKETQIQEMLTGKTIDFPKLMDKLDEYDLLERRKQQYDTVLGQLFPEDVETK